MIVHACVYMYSLENHIASLVFLRHNLLSTQSMLLMMQASYIAEGAGEFSPNEKIRFYRMARRSATECAGILDICTRLNLIDEDMSSKSRGLLLRIVSMLTKMARTSSATQAGMQTFT